MPPVYRYRTSPGVYADLSSYFRLYQLDVAMNAEEGSVAQSTIVADDPSGDLDIVGLRNFYITESTATSSNTRIYNGYVAERRYKRGESLRTTTARQVEVGLVDLNTILHRRVMVGSGNKRPAETDVARLLWLLGTEEASPLNDTLYVNTSGAVAMDAADYNGQKFSDVIDDLAQASGKNWFAWYREEVNEWSLWYDFASSTSYSSPLRLTNVASEVDSSLTFAISGDTQLSRSPDRVFSGAYVPFDGGVAYEQSTATANNYIRRDAVMPSANVKSLTKATARATRYLGEMDTEEDVITTSVILPAAKVNFLMHGMRVQLKATHLPGYEGYSWARVLNRSVSQISEEFYEVKCEMSVEPAVTVGCPDCTAAPTLVQYRATTRDGGTGASWEVHMNSAPTECNFLVAVITNRGSFPVADQAGWTTVPGTVHVDGSNPGDTKVIYRPVVAGDSSTIIFNIGLPARVVVMEWSGLDILDTSGTTAAATNTNAAVSSASLALSGGNRVIVGVVAVSGPGVAGGTSQPQFSISAPLTQLDFGWMAASEGPTHAVGYRILTPASGSYDMDVSLTVGGFTNEGQVATIICAFRCVG